MDMLYRTYFLFALDALLEDRRGKQICLSYVTYVVGS